MTTYLVTKEKDLARGSVRIPSKAKLADFRDYVDSHTRGKSEATLVIDDHATIGDIFHRCRDNFFEGQAQLRKKVKLLLVDDIPPTALNALEALFKNATVLPRRSSLPMEEMVEIIAKNDAKDYVIGGQCDRLTETVTLIRGDLSKLAVPFSAFRPSGSGIEPDFSNLSIDDFGQSICLGKYGASTHSILYEFDPTYRKEKKVAIAKHDKGFGACLRRLRILKQLKQSDFPGVTSKEIVRIEQGKVTPHSQTLSKIAKALEVTPDEISSY